VCKLYSCTLAAVNKILLALLAACAAGTLHCLYRLVWCVLLLLQADVEAAVYLMMANEMVHNLLPDVSGGPMHASSGLGLHSAACCSCACCCICCMHPSKACSVGLSVCWTIWPCSKPVFSCTSLHNFTQMVMICFTFVSLSTTTTTTHWSAVPCCAVLCRAGHHHC
jgi:hypothetical protein